MTKVTDKDLLEVIQDLAGTATAAAELIDNETGDIIKDTVSLSLAIADKYRRQQNG